MPIVDLARLHLDCIMLAVLPLDAIMIPAHDRDIRAGLSSVMIDETFADQLRLYKRGCEVYSDELKFKLEAFITAKVQSVRGHPEAYLSRSVLDVFRGEAWSRVQLFVFVDEGHLIVKWGDEYR